MSASTTTSSSSSYAGADYSPVVIVGGGPSGLFLSNLLSSNYHVPHRLLEAQTVESRFRHPQAHFLNTRSMELLYHWLPDLYRDIRAAMPPVEQWKSFRFCTSMSQMNPLAEVVHPVHRPLQANRDANGVLRESLVEPQPDAPASSSFSNHADLSVCTVGHLAQHTFGRILYDHAQANASATAVAAQSSSFDTQLLYGTTVTNVVHCDDASAAGRHSLVVETSAGQKIATSLVVAADGVHSMLRRSRGIGVSGPEGVQHLINIHVKLSPEQAERLHRGSNYAMLYSVLSPEVLAMVVCHSVGEYVIQIPYFPPYQTLEKDFGPSRCQVLIKSIFGPSVDAWDLVSVRPWTMNASVADRYYTDDGIVLVGDAAHVFPPAGGFGMNTGMQDVHNLAWKIAWAYHNNRLTDHAAMRSLLQSYHDERRPVAQQNAALSIRNYQRLLKVFKTCYLDEQHSVVALSVLNKSPLPLGLRQSTLRSLLKTVMYPLSWLDQPNSLYAQHIRQNLARVLKSGAGLPLLFPNFELHFRYSNAVGVTANQDKTTSNSSDKTKKVQLASLLRDDTWASQPTLELGGLVPHVRLVVVSGAAHYPQLQWLPTTTTPGTTTTTSTEPHTTISSSNLPAQLARSSSSSSSSSLSLPTFVLLCVGSRPAMIQSATHVAQAVSERIGLPVEMAHIVFDRNDLPDYNSKNNNDKNNHPCLVLHELSTVGDEDQNKKKDNSGFSFLQPNAAPYWLLVRPDGHIASIVPFDIAAADAVVDENQIITTFCNNVAHIMKIS